MNDGFASMVYSVGKKNYLFQTEAFDMVYKHISEILIRNHEETGVYDIPLDPDFQRYLEIENDGGLKFMTVCYQSEIVGYAMFFIDTQIYQRNIVSATQSLNFIDKKHRGIGYAFMKFCDDILLKQGVNSVWRQATIKFDVGKLYERMGYKLIEKSYLRRF